MKAKNIADYLLLKAKSDEDYITNMKLQKLLYYVQGFHLAVFDKPLFDSQIKNWMHGPVVPDVYHEFKEYGKGVIPFPTDADITEFSDESIELVDEVYGVYSQFTAWALRNSTHSEPPWINTENFETISHSSLRSYFKTQLN